MPTALVVRAAGTNCDQEMCRAFALAGAEVDLVHVDRLIAEPARVGRYDLIGFPGGFSYGDDIASGRIFAVRLRENLWPALREAAARGVPMIGACNGFQVLVQVGLLPGPEVAAGGAGAEGGEIEPALVWKDAAPAQRAALSENVRGRFEDRWVGVEFDEASPCLWTRGVAERARAGVAGDDDAGRDVLMLPVAHGEGRFVADRPETLAALQRRGQVPLRYTDNYNGSEGAVAGVCDATGRIFGLMPHPERYLDWTRHPYFTRLDAGTRAGATIGRMMFENAVREVVESRSHAVTR
jgi:phosphoribosylformylglycinamidine synthase